MQDLATAYAGKSATVMSETVAKHRVIFEEVRPCSELPGVVFNGSPAQSITYPAVIYRSEHFILDQADRDGIMDGI